MNAYEQLLGPIHQFLHCRTPQAWVATASAPEQLPRLLIDHMHCELKAAQSAALLLRRYAVTQASGDALLAWLKPYEDFVYRQLGDGVFGSRKNDLAQLEVQAQPDHLSASVAADFAAKMMRLIREELHHFEQVLALIRAREIPLEYVTAARYASGLMQSVRTYEPEALIDKLIIGAFIEARSCERFASLAPHLDPELQAFYVSLLRSEARHYQDYLALAQTISATDITARVAAIGAREAQLIKAEDAEFRFHSGVPRLSVA